MTPHRLTEKYLAVCKSLNPGTEYRMKIKDKNKMLKI